MGEAQFPASTRNKVNQELDRQLGFTKGAGSADDDENRTSERTVEADTEQQRVISINVGGHLAREHTNNFPGS